MSHIEGDGHLQTLERLLGRALCGEGQAVVIDGLVGAGKTVLLRSFAERALELGALTISAGCSRVERELPLGVLGQLFLDASLQPAERRVALALVEEVSDTRGLDERLLTTLRKVLLHLAEQYPLVVAVDDAHHADAASLSYLTHLCRGMGSARIMVVLTRAEQDSELIGGAHRIVLAPLSRDGMHAFLTARGDDAAVRHADGWHELTGGNPALAAALLEDQGTPGTHFGGAVVSCLHRAGSLAMDVAKGLAILEDAETVCALVDGDVPATMRMLTRAGLLDGQAFRHPMARQAVLEIMERGEPDMWRSRAADLRHVRVPQDPGGGSNESELALAGALTGKALARAVQDAELTLIAVEAQAAAQLPDMPLFSLDGSEPGTSSLETYVSPTAIENALLTLLYGGHIGQASDWCDRLSTDAVERHTPGHRARLSAIRAEIALRRGDLAGARRHAGAAFDIVPPAYWGVAAASPLSTMAIAATAMGELDSGLLDYPLPDILDSTGYGLHHLYARARHHLATAAPESALRDLRHCGELMAAWDLDSPGLLPWRVDAAEALIAVGRTAAACHLLEAHLRACQDAPRERGMALRALASASEPRRRPALLRHAAELLREAGDRYELARALHDQAGAYDLLGENRRAVDLATRAHSVAAECGAVPLVTALAADLVPAAASTLSGAERRVATLAAAGRTDREIAAELFITVSTVEQHLTRTYQKLEVSGRDELPAGRALDFA